MWLLSALGKLSLILSNSIELGSVRAWRPALSLSPLPTSLAAFALLFSPEQHPPQFCGQDYRGGFAERPRVQHFVKGGHFNESSISAKASVNAVVNDLWFAAPPDVAWTWTWIYDSYRQYASELAHDLLHQRKLPHALFAHVYWGWHVSTVLAPAGVRVAYVASDFALTRACMYGLACAVPLNVSGRVRALIRSERPAERLRSMPEPTDATPVPNQCPSSLHYAEQVHCSWDSPACAAARSAKWQRSVRVKTSECARLARRERQALVQA